MSKNICVHCGSDLREVGIYSLEEVKCVKYNKRYNKEFEGFDFSEDFSIIDDEKGKTEYHCCKCGDKIPEEDNFLLC